MFLFKKLPKGWYSRDGYNHCCKLCNLRKPTRYTRKQGAMFATLVPRNTSILERLKDLFG